MAGPIETTLINKWMSLEGCNHLFPAGTKALIARRVDDSKKKVSVYQGIVFHDLTKTCMDVTFDAKTLKHVDHKSSNLYCPFNVSLVLELP